mmetsp:Transcript_39677/g.85801  ORF Transcript_39677/g.85801 Transcript_39677/m.85801 type:complete len:205 (+) Transcript_39677:50-664(+)
MCESPRDEEYSLGVTQLLDDLLGKQEKRPDEEGSLSPPHQEAMRRTFQRTQEFCDEAQKYMDLIAKEEADARREADQKRKRAERRWGFAETADSNVFNGSSESFFDAIQENEKRLAEVHQDLVDIMETKGRQVPVKPSPVSPFGQTIDFHSSLGCTFTEDDGDDASPILDFEQLLAHCEKMQAELEHWGDQRNTPRGWQRLDED